MSKILPNKSKSNKFLNIVYLNQSGKQQTQFLKSYSQLLNQHFNLSKSQLLRKNRNSSANENRPGFQEWKKSNKTKSSKHKRNPSKQADQKQIIDLQNRYEITKKMSQTQTAFKSKANPQQQQRTKQQITREIQMRKTFQFQKDSGQNHIIVNKLKQSQNSKNQLTIQIQRLRQQIARQKRLKYQTSTQLRILMNENENKMIAFEKCQKQKNEFIYEIQSTIGQIEKIKRKNEKLVSIHEHNIKRTEIQRQLIEGLEQKIQIDKTKISQIKTFVNQFKALHRQQSNCLIKLQMNHLIISTDRDHVWNVVHSCAELSKDGNKV